MANSNDIKNLKKDIEEAIEDGFKLFKYYKKISKEFQENQKNLMNNKELKKELENNIKEKYEEEKKFIEAKRIEIEKRKSMPDYLKAREIHKLATEKKLAKNNYEKELIKHKKEYEKLSEVYLVNSDKKFLKEKEEIRKNKKRILSRIKIALSQLKKKMFKDEYKQFIKDIKELEYQISNNKTITGKILINHLESGIISEKASKKTKQINDLETINNIGSRKREMEYEINKLKEELKEIKKAEKLKKIK